MESVSVNKKAEFDKVMTKLVLDVPLFGIMLKRLRVVYLPKYPLDGTDDTTVAAAVNEREILITDKFFEESVDDRMFTLSHEVMHVLSGHPERLAELWLTYEGRVPPNVFNLVCNIMADAKVNQWLSAKYKLPSSVVTPFTLSMVFDIPRQDFDASSMEDLVGRALKNLPKNRISEYGNACGGMVAYASNKKAFGGNGVVVINEGLPGLQSSHDDQLRKVKTNIISDSMVVAKTMGSDPSFLERAFDDLYASDVNWKRVIRATLGFIGYEDVRKIWSRPNRKSDLLPFKSDVGRGIIWCLVDTSGSIGKQEINRWVSEVFAIARLKAEVVVVSWDTIVHDVIKIRKRADINKITLHGGGWTQIRPALLYVQKERRFGDTVIVFSDFDIGDLHEADVKKMLAKTINFTTNVSPSILEKEYHVKAKHIRVK
jgi:predicted metal-dependent peptidase